MPCDQVDEVLEEAEVVDKDELLLLLGCCVDVAEPQVAVPVPHDACPCGWWYASGSPYPPGRADAPPTAAIKARVRSMMGDLCRISVNQSDSVVLSGKGMSKEKT